MRVVRLSEHNWRIEIETGADTLNSAMTRARVRLDKSFEQMDFEVVEGLWQRLKGPVGQIVAALSSGAAIGAGTAAWWIR